MASFEFGNALLLQNPLLQSTVLDSVINVFEPTERGYLQFQDTGGKIWMEYNQVNSYGSTDAAFVSTGAVTHSAATFTQVARRVLTVAKQVRVPRVYTSDPVFAAQQIQLAAKRVGNAWAAAFSTSANPADITLQIECVGGLAAAAGANQSVSAGSATCAAALSFTQLDAVADAVKDGGQKVYMMNPRTIRSYRALCRTAGVSPQEIVVGNFGMPQLMHNGTPILRSDHIEINMTEGAVTNTDCTKVYCFGTDVDSGLHGFYNGPSVLQVIGPYEVTATVSQEYSVEYNVGLALKSNLAIAQLKGINN